MLEGEEGREEGWWVVVFLSVFHINRHLYFEASSSSSIERRQSTFEGERLMRIGGGRRVGTRSSQNLRLDCPRALFNSPALNCSPAQTRIFCGQRARVQRQAADRQVDEAGVMVVLLRPPPPLGVHSKICGERPIARSHSLLRSPAHAPAPAHAFALLDAARRVMQKSAVSVRAPSLLPPASRPPPQLALFNAPAFNCMTSWRAGSRRECVPLAAARSLARSHSKICG